MSQRRDFPDRKLTALDIMHTDVVVVSPSDTLREAMSLINENHVGGLPVLDRKDRCVGVISATDILGFEQEESEFTSGMDEGLSPYFNPETQRWEQIRTRHSADDLPDVPVRDLMSTDLAYVRPRTPIGDVARKMLEHEIHRILVLDNKQYLHGIISTVDFVRLFVESE